MCFEPPTYPPVPLPIMSTTYDTKVCLARFDLRIFAFKLRTPGLVTGMTGRFRPDG